MSPVKEDEQVGTNDSLSYEEVQEAIEGKDEGYINEFLKEKFESNPELGIEFINDEEAFKKKYLTAPDNPDDETESHDGSPAKEDGEPAVTPDGEPDKDAEPKKDKEVAEEEIEVTLKLKPDWLGTYGKDRKPEEAVIEALKGNREKDNFIDILKEENRDVKKQLNTVSGSQRALRESLEAKKKPKKERKKVEYPEFTDDDDVFSEEYQKKMRAYVTASKDEITSLKDENDELKAGQTELNSKVETGGSNNEVDSEVQEVDRLRKRYSGSGFEFKRSITDVEGDYLDFVTRLKGVAGITTPIYAPALGKSGEQLYNTDGSPAVITGKFHPKVAEAYELYHDSEKGKELRSKCEEKGIKLPDDFDDLITVYKLRGIRREIQEETGGARPISFERALDIFRKDNPAPVSKMDKKLDDHKATVKAVENRKKFAKETKASDGASPIDLDKVETVDFEKLINKIHKGLATTEEVIYAESVLEKVENGKLSKEEIKEMLTPSDHVL